MIKTGLHTKHNTTKLKLRHHHHHHTPALAHNVALCMDGELGGRCFFLTRCSRCKTTHWPPLRPDSAGTACVYVCTAEDKMSIQKHTPLVGEMDI